MGDGGKGSAPRPFSVSNEEYARQLYSAFRLADSKKIERVFAVPLENEGIAVAINNRLSKAAHQI